MELAKTAHEINQFYSQIFYLCTGIIQCYKIKDYSEMGVTLQEGAQDCEEQTVN